MTRVAVLSGDGIGQEVIPVAWDIIGSLHPEFDSFEVEVGYARWKKSGVACTDDDITALKEADAILFGAITTPPDPCYRSVILGIRQRLDLYANLRPVKGNGFDIMIVRENSEGLYSGIEWQEKDRACTVRVVSVEGSRRIARAAIRLAEERGCHLTIGNKANVIKSDVLFRDICCHEAAEAGVSFEACYIDSLALDLLLHPASYGVIVTTNIFGDILSDVAGYLVGGLGMLPSANIGDRYALFEPVHGSAPDIAGQGIANPVAAIRSGAMLLEYLGHKDDAIRIEAAIQTVIKRGIKTPDLGGMATTQSFGEAVKAELGI
ncbi:isocitrate/isopropylmalate dehydrogenase family protein [Methanocalculus taiwanensis]|uniref:3-isopropylmalate dehydrogenase n=1 Tax=Methanocalculus taiwanensis TaxID=106207 RepID=A0ABD4TK18_9EURY|nr:isocitrate/isopropylmalate dehydrogenase family protein [Methanocalculus taiwanensis]MCQ1539254.1 isocitrate/isopropylmalate dehydrogenase family protein [Methanocalculus taiwanensis]